MGNKLFILVVGIVLLVSTFGFVSAANSDGILQMWRNKTTDTNVSWVDNNGNWYGLGNFNLSGIFYGNGSGLTDINVDAIDLSGYVPYTGASSNLVLGDNNFSVGTSDFFVDNVGGNVGIGTGSPDKKLDLGGGDINLRTNGAIFFDNLNDNNAWYVGNRGSNAATLVFGLGETEFADDKIVFLSSGYVGIGTTTPQNKLNVIGDGNFTGNIYSNGEQVLTTSDSAVEVDPYWTGNSTLVPYLASENTFTNNNILNGNLTVGSNNLFVDNESGYVGIGTGSPTNKLDVQGSISLATGSNLIWGGTYGAGTPTIAGTSSSLRFYPAGSTSGEKMRIDSSGNVGIGTTSPVASLEIDGDSMIWNNEVKKQVAERVSVSASSKHEITIDWPSTDSGPIILDVEVLIDTNSVATTHYVKKRFYLTSYSGNSAGDLYTQRSYVVDSLDGSSTSYNYIGTFEENTTAGEIVLPIYSGSGNNRANSVILTAWGTNAVADLILDATYTANVETGITPPARAPVEAPIHDDFIFSQNVGIGTTSPQNKLDVEGGAVIGAGYSGTNTAPSNGLLVEGNVGIGTASPARELHVNGDILSNATINATGDICIEGGNCLSDLSVNAVDGTGLANRAAFWTDEDTLSYDGNFTWDNSNKRLGIGTASPSAELDVQGDIYLTGGDKYLRSTEGFLALMSSTSYVHLASAENQSMYFDAGGDFNFRDQDASDAIRMIIKSNSGYVGIGTSSPISLLHLNGSGSSGGISFGDGDTKIFELVDDIFAFNANSITSFYVSSGSLQGGTSQSWQLSNSIASATVPNILSNRSDTNTGIGGSGGDMLSLVAGGINGLNVKETGGIVQVGIGTTSPTQALHVEGSMNITGNISLSQGGNIYNNGTEVIIEY